MSSSERQRRFLERIRASGTAVSSNALEAECVKLKDECAKLKSENATLKRLLDEAREHVRKLEARRERPQPQPKAQPISGDAEMEQKLKALKKKIAELRYRLRTVQYSDKGAVFLKPGDRRKILSALHPDNEVNPATKRRLEVAFQIINDLFESGKIKEISEDE